MLEANKSRAFERIFAVYNRNLLKRRFQTLRVFGLDFLLDENINYPLTIYCNHSTWWDGLIAFQVSRELKAESFFLMEEKHLRKYPLFKKLGAFSVVRERSREILKSLDYAARLLNDSGNRILWIFPQGEILPNDRRPLKFYNGLARIIQKTGKCSVASLAMRFEFLGEFKPHIFVRIEKPDLILVDSNFDPKKQTEFFAKKLTGNLDQIKSDILARNLNEYISII